MNGIEKIINRIESEANQEAEEIRLDTKRQCGEIKEKYEKDAQEEYWKIVKNGVKTCEQMVARMGKTAAMEAKQSMLALKQDMIARAFDRSKELIASLDEKQYVAFLAKLAAQAARTGGEEIILNERDTAKYGKAAEEAANSLLAAKGISGRLKLSDRTRPILGGIVLKDGDIEVNCSIEALVELHRNDLAPQVADVMFNERR